MTFYIAENEFLNWVFNFTKCQLLGENQENQAANESVLEQFCSKIYHKCQFSG